MKLFDTHTHYDDKAYNEDRDKVITRLLDDNVAGFIAVGCTLDRSKKAAALAAQYTNVYAAVGIHPQDVENLPKNYLQTLETFAKNYKVKAIGEVGLEYCREYNETLQKRIFREQLELAVSLNLPVIIHSREAFKDTFEILREYRLKNNLEAVCHCFSGDGEDAKKLADIGVLISFTGNITFKKAERTANACKSMPLELIMLETDCPYLAPEPFRGKRCDSGMTWYTAKKIAQIKKCTTEEIVEISNSNAKRFFGIEF